MLETSALKRLTVAIYIINWVDNTKLPSYNLPLMQHHTFFRILPPLFIWMIDGMSKGVSSQRNCDAASLGEYNRVI